MENRDNQAQRGATIRAAQFNSLSSRVDRLALPSSGRGVSVSAVNGTLYPSQSPSGLRSMTGPMMLGINVSATAYIKSWQPVAVTGVVRSNPERQRSITLRVEPITESDHLSRFGIAQAPIAPGGSGDIFVPGATLVRATGTGDWASPALNADAMALDSSGSYAVLWSDATTGLALIMMGAGASSAESTWAVWDEK